MRKKSFVLVFVTSIISFVILLSTVMGYKLYLRWKEESLAGEYKRFIYNITAEIFRKDLEISGVRFFVQNMVGKPGAAPGVPVLEGKIKNNFNKVATSMRIEFSFEDSAGTVIYNGWFYPLGKEGIEGSPFFSSTKKISNILLPGESMIFRRVLRNMPAEVFERMSRAGDFAKEKPEDEVRIILKVTGMSVI